MRRRQVLGLIGGSAVSGPVRLRAQTDGVRRIGILMAFKEDDPRTKRWLSLVAQGLAQSGWIEGRNLRTQLRWAGDNVDQMRVFAQDLASLHPDAILAFGTPATAAAQRETQTIPIIFAIVSDPVGEGFVRSLARPGGNITGFHDSEAAMGGKWLELLTQIAPSAKRAAMIFNPATAPGHGSYYMPAFAAAGQSLHVSTFSALVHDVAELQSVIAELGREPGGCFVAAADFFLFINCSMMIACAAQNKVPAVYPWREAVSGGGLLSYGPELEDMVRRAVPYVDRILRGEKPAELPVQVPIKFEMAVNVRTAKDLNLTLPPTLLIQADEIVE